jgi:carbon-monoxide dehydrogenase medium subunit
VKAAPFSYHAPATVAEALGLLAEHGDDAKVLAGGQSLVPMLALRIARYEHLIDLNGIAALSVVERRGDVLSIGALTRQADVLRNPDLASGAPLLAAATPFLGHAQIRNRGTVGGSIAHADPAAEYPAVALALDATLVIAGPVGERRVPAAEFFAGMWETAVEPDEILVAVELPVWVGDVRVGVHEVAPRAGDFALAGAVVALTIEDGHIARAAVGLLGLGSTPLRATATEAALVGAPAGGGAGLDLEHLGRLAVDGLHPPTDIHGSAAYRSRAAAATVRRAITTALEEAA